MTRKPPPRLGPSLLLGAVLTIVVGLIFLMWFAKLLAGKWVWVRGFYLNGSQWFDAARTTVTLVGIIGLGSAAYLTYRRQLSVEAAHHLAETAALHDRYMKAAEQLGHNNPAIRQAGVYALASLADDWHSFGSDDERQVCIDLLCAYLRAKPVPVETAAALPSPPRPQTPAVGRLPWRIRPAPPRELPQNPREKDMRTAIIGVIRDRTGRADNHWASCQFDLAFAELPGADLRGARLIDADLYGVVLYRARLADAVLIRADLREAQLWGTDLTGIDLTEAYLLRANLRGAHLQGANLTGATLAGIDLPPMANMAEANLTRTNLHSAKLPCANLTKATMFRADVSTAKLIGADLSGANMTKADLTDTDLTGANLTGADLTGAVLDRCNLTRANLARATLAGVRYDDAPIWPRGYTPPPSTH